MTDIDYMKIALALALKGRGRTSPNPMVGALVVKDNKIVGQGWHRICGGPHAEIFALRKAGQKARGATLVVTLEPCYHFGRTPPCVDAIIRSGIKEVIIGTKDPNPLVNGKSIRKLQGAGIKVHCGVLQAELKTLNEAFFTYIVKARPFVVAKIAQTVDGKIATATGQSKWITSDKTRKYARRLRNDFDAILVGFNTVLKDDPRLTAASKTKVLKKIILDPCLRINPHAQLFENSKPGNCFLATTSQAPRKIADAFLRKGYQVIICPAYGHNIHLQWLMGELARRQVASILIEGGAHVIGSALREKIVDKMHIYIAPKIIGDQRALSSVSGLEILEIKEALQLINTNFKQIGADLFLEGYVQYNQKTIGYRPWFRGHRLLPGNAREWLQAKRLTKDKKSITENHYVFRDR